jgi:hypothetical protein
MLNRKVLAIAIRSKKIFKRYVEKEVFDNVKVEFCVGD